MKSTRLIVAIFAALAITALVDTRGVRAQDAPADSVITDAPADSVIPDAPADPATSADSSSDADASWQRTGSAPDPTIDDDAETAEKVLEIPQAVCATDNPPASCDSNDADADADDDSQAINAPSPGSPPPTVDDNTANSNLPSDNFGDADDYQNQEVNGIPYTVPYAVYPYPTTAAAGTNLTSGPAAPYVPAGLPSMPMSSPLTQAARPPLNPGPWMTHPSMSMYSHPAGSPMVAFGFHH